MVSSVLIAHRLALKDSRLALAAQLYAAIARKFTPALYQGLLGIAQVLATVERKRPSGSGRQVRSRARSVVAAAFQAGILGRNAGPAAGINLLGADEAECAILIILLMMVQDGDNDLQQQMANAYAMMQVKQAIRAELEKANQEIANLAQSPGDSGSPAMSNSLPFTQPQQGYFIDALEDLARLMHLHN